MDDRQKLISALVNQAGYTVTFESELLYVGLHQKIPDHLLKTINDILPVSELDLSDDDHDYFLYLYINKPT